MTRGIWFDYQNFFAHESMQQDAASLPPRCMAAVSPDDAFQVSDPDQTKCAKKLAEHMKVALGSLRLDEEGSNVKSNEPKQTLRDRFKMLKRVGDPARRR